LEQVGNFKIEMVVGFMITKTVLAAREPLLRVMEKRTRAEGPKGRDGREGTEAPHLRKVAMPRSLDEIARMRGR